MLDNNYERDGHGDPSRERPNRSSESGPISDREVPLAPVATSDMINRWLDGELPEPSGLRGDAAKSVEFWRRIGEETDRRSHMVTPAHVQDRIMAALPTTHNTLVMATWWKKPMQLTPMAAIAAAAGIFALGVVIANVMSLR